MVKILLVGSDFRLLATRAAVLSRTGANTVCCSLPEMMRGFGREVFQLVLLCHSLSKDEAVVASALARESWPTAKILLLNSPLLLEDPELVECDRVITSEPSLLIQEIGSILSELPVAR
jgi:hypothetical protein